MLLPIKFFKYRFNDILLETFNDRLDFDKENKYQPDNLNAYFENHIIASVHKIDASKTISEIIQEKWYKYFSYDTFK